MNEEIGRPTYHPHRSHGCEPKPIQGGKERDYQPQYRSVKYVKPIKCCY